MNFELPQQETLCRVQMLGPDAIDFGQRLFSRNLKLLTEGQGLLSLFLSSDGKVLCLFWVIRLNAALELYIQKSQMPRLVELVEHYHFTEDFELHPPEELFGYWAKAGQNSVSGTAYKQGGHLKASWRGLDFLFSPKEDPASSKDSWDVARIEHLIPKAGVDYNENTLVFEPGFHELCDENKGCYPGQEVVERVRSRGGNSPSALCLLKSETEMKPGDHVWLDSQAIGQITSAARHHDNYWLGLGILKRKQIQDSQVILSLQNGTSYLKLLKFCQ